MKRKKASDVLGYKPPLCVQCGKGLALCDLGSLVGCCINPKCPNYSLMCIIEESILKFTRGLKDESSI
jgi:hypothetical protein